MQAFIPVFLGIGVFICAFGYMTYRNNAAKRTREKITAEPVRL